MQRQRRRSPSSRGGRSMALFITIGYGDREGYDRTDPGVPDAAHEHDARLRSDGVVMGVAGAPGGRLRRGRHGVCAALAGGRSMRSVVGSRLTGQMTNSPVDSSAWEPLFKT